MDYCLLKHQKKKKLVTKISAFFSYSNIFKNTSCIKLLACKVDIVTSSGMGILSHVTGLKGSDDLNNFYYTVVIFITTV